MQADSQLPLFGDVPTASTPTAEQARAEEARRLVRRAHPGTSLLAASEMVNSGDLKSHAADAFALVRRYPDCTGHELDQHDCRQRGITNNRRRISKRLGGLANDGFVVRGDRRTCKVTGNACVTWRVAPTPTTPMGLQSSNSVSEPKSEAKPMPDPLPDQLTCHKIPSDNNGDPLEIDRCYKIGGKLVVCFYDTTYGEMCVQECHRIGVVVPGSRPQLVAELPANVAPIRFEEAEQPK